MAFRAYLTIGMALSLFCNKKYIYFIRDGKHSNVNFFKYTL